MPTANCSGTPTNSVHRSASADLATSIIVTVRITAIGSLMHDSTSSVLPTRGRRLSRPPRSTASTAAASVDETTAPSNSASVHPRPSHRPNTATNPAVKATPAVAKIPAGTMIWRTAHHDAFIPPSSKISTR